MVQMAMRQQNLVNLAKAEPAAQQLPLRALSAIDHETLVAI